MSRPSARGWGAGWPTDRTADQVKVARPGGTAVAAWVHRAIVPLVVEGLRRTEEVAGYDVRMLGGFANRPIRGSTTAPSNHSWGLAIDINWDTNPMVSGALVTDMPGPMVAVWKNLGFGWGGNYNSRKDAMHFEFLGTPAQAASIGTTLGLAHIDETPAPGAPVSAHPVLKVGAKGDSVVLLQGGLNQHGNTLKADGDFGKRTLGCVVSFQRGASLLPDGVVGPKTWAAVGV